VLLHVLADALRLPASIHALLDRADLARVARPPGQHHGGSVPLPRPELVWPTKQRLIED
jgi:hypothetical protein